MYVAHLIEAFIIYLLKKNTFLYYNYIQNPIITYHTI